MKVVHSEYDLQLDLRENKVNVLVIENRTLFAELVSELYRQCGGAEGRFVVSQNDEIQPFSKCVEIITDILGIDCNEKKLLSRLYQEMEGLALENLISESTGLKSAILCYLEKMCGQVPYHLEYQQEFLPSKIMKMADLKFRSEAGSILEKIIEYLDIASKVQSESIRIFVNLKMFLEEDALQNLYEYAFYNKIALVLIEGVTGKANSMEQITIIDVDKCIIRL